MGGYCCPLSLGWAVGIRPCGGPGRRMWWAELYMGGPGPPFIPPGPLGRGCILMSLGGWSKFNNIINTDEPRQLTDLLSNRKQTKDLNYLFITHLKILKTAASQKQR